MPELKYVGMTENIRNSKNDFLLNDQVDLFHWDLLCLDVLVIYFKRFSVISVATVESFNPQLPSPNILTIKSFVD